MWFCADTLDVIPQNVYDRFSLYVFMAVEIPLCMDAAEIQVSCPFICTEKCMQQQSSQGLYLPCSDRSVCEERQNLEGSNVCRICCAVGPTPSSESPPVWLPEEGVCLVPTIFPLASGRVAGNTEAFLPGSRSPRGYTCKWNSGYKRAFSFWKFLLASNKSHCFRYRLSFGTKTSLLLSLQACS